MQCVGFRLIPRSSKISPNSKFYNSKAVLHPHQKVPGIYKWTLGICYRFLIFSFQQLCIIRCWSVKFLNFLWCLIPLKNFGEIFIIERIQNNYICNMILLAFLKRKFPLSKCCLLRLWKNWSLNLLQCYVLQYIKNIRRTMFLYPVIVVYVKLAWSFDVYIDFCVKTIIVH